MTSTPPARKRPLIRGSSNVEHRPSKASKTKPTPRAKLMQPKQTPEQRQVKAAAASALSRSINEKGKGRARDEDEDQDDDVIYAKDAQGNDTSNVFSPVPGGEHSTTDDIFEGFTQIVGKRG